MAAGRIIAEHFATVGVRHPTFISAAPNRCKFSAVRQIFAGFENSCAEFDLPVASECREYGELDIEAGMQAFHPLFTRTLI